MTKDARFRSLHELSQDTHAVKGIVCPRCHCQQFRVDATRNVIGGIARYRVCRNCGARWRTDEH